MQTAALVKSQHSCWRCVCLHGTLPAWQGCTVCQCLLPKGPGEPGRRSSPVDPSVLPIIIGQHPAPARHRDTAAELTNERLTSQCLVAKRGFFGSCSLPLRDGGEHNNWWCDQACSFGLPPPPPFMFSTPSPPLLSDAEKTLSS